MVKKEEEKVEEEAPAKRKRKIPTKLILIVVALVIVLLVAGYPTYYFYDKYQDAQLLLKNPKQAAQNEAKSLVEKIGKLIDLPKDEIPTIATVSDKTKLASQPFFAKAENGDKVLIFNKAKKAIIYRPSINKIIEVSAITLSVNSLEGQNEASPSAAISKGPKVVLLNGTTTTGLTRTAEDRLTSDKIVAEIVDRDNAKSQDYTKTIIIDLTGENTEIAQKMATALGGEVGELPEGESGAEGTEILVILGSDFAVE